MMRSGGFELATRRIERLRRSGLATIPLVAGLGLVIWATPAFAAHILPTVQLVAASTTDPAIDDVIGMHHVALGPQSERVGRLLVFLPGTTAPPQIYSQLIEGAARQGYHAIGLAYVNPAAVNVLCFGMAASGCHEMVRREIILGTDETTLVDVDFDNSIVNRLDRLLAHLESIAPNEGWDSYRNAVGQLRWERVVVAGHSQGAGHAAFIARLESVARAVLFSGTEAAAWTQAGDFVTPASNIWAFGHSLEAFISAFQSSWDNIGIPGIPTSVDGVGAPFGTSQQLTTSNTNCTGDPQANGFYHNCHCVDGFMPPPLPDGTPYFQYVWDELFRFESTPAVPSLDPIGIGALLLTLVLLSKWNLRQSTAGRIRVRPASIRTRPAAISRMASGSSRRSRA